MSRKNDKRMSSDVQETIISIIKRWKHSQGSLSLPAVIKRMEELGIPTFSRQALRNRLKIKGALLDRQNYLALPSSKRGASFELENAYCKIDALKEENRQLKELNRELKEQFLRWQYNAAVSMQKYKLSRAVLEQPVEDGKLVTQSELDEAAKELGEPIVRSRKNGEG